MFNTQNLNCILPSQVLRISLDQRSRFFCEIDDIAQRQFLRYAEMYSKAKKADMQKVTEIAGTVGAIVGSSGGILAGAEVGGVICSAICPGLTIPIVVGKIFFALLGEFVCTKIGRVTGEAIVTLLPNINNFHRRKCVVDVCMQEKVRFAAMMSKIMVRRGQLQPEEQNEITQLELLWQHAIESIEQLDQAQQATTNNQFNEDFAM